MVWVDLRLKNLQFSPKMTVFVLEVWAWHPNMHDAVVSRAIALDCVVGGVMDLSKLK